MKPLKYISKDVYEDAVKNPIIGIYKGKLSDRREYGMLLNCDIFGK
jgi:hypothetical protein